MAKSMEHLHCHIIPNNRIGDLDYERKERRVMTQEEIMSTTREIQEAMKKLTFTGL